MGELVGQEVVVELRVVRDQDAAPSSAPTCGAISS